MSFIPLDHLRPSSAIGSSNSSSTLSPQPSALSPSDHISRPRLPSWFKVEAKTGPDYLDIKQTMERLNLHTICEEARCPNRWECWNARTATFLILGDICTRRCHYCSVETGRPLAVDHEEPRRVAEAVQALGLRHAVITSVNRDELADGGAAVFAETIRHTRRLSPLCTIEVLIPDFEEIGRASCRERV
jgi:lipoic acid synthetase